MATIDFTHTCFNHGLDQPTGLILPAPTHVYWTVQTSGTLCRQRTAEGVFIPLNMAEDDLDALTRLWKEMQSLVNPVAGELVSRTQLLNRTDDLFLNMSPRFGNLPLRCDHVRGIESSEAWVYVQIVPNVVGNGLPGELHPLSRELGGREAILVWQNSD